MRLDHRVVALTGGSAGIGRAVAERAAAEGAAVVLSARRADRLDEAAAGIIAAGGRALVVPGDVTRPDDMDALVARGVQVFGRLDAIVCNAGIGYQGSLEETPPDVMRRIVDVNLLGTLYAARAAMRQFHRQGSGHIVVISSMAGRRGIAGTAVYGASKAAQIALVESLRAEFDGTPFHASVVYPVSVPTEFREAIQRDFGVQVSGGGPQQSADEVARAVVDCLVSPKPEVYPHRAARGLAILAVLAPAWTDRFVKRFARRRESEREP